MTEITAKTPWAGHTGDVPLHLDYFDGSMFEALELVAKKYPRNIAFDFMGKATTYPQMIEEIKKCARSLKTIGVRAGDKVTIAMPNCPQAIYMFYAVNLVGGIGEGDRVLPQRVRERHSYHARPVLQQVREHPPEHKGRQHHHRERQG